MQIYKNINGNSGVESYEIGEDFIIVKFKLQSFSARDTYKYAYASAGVDNVERMKQLAGLGYGLNSLINRFVKYKYDRNFR
jgi:hypothetical protein